MNSVSLYIFNTAPFILIIIPLYAVIRLIVIKNRHDIKPNYYFETALLTYITILVCLASQTIVPNITISEGRWYLGQPGIGGINLTLFNVFRQTRYEVFVNGNISYFTVNFLGNILIFMPVSFFPLLLFKKKHPVLFSLVLGFGVSLFIECVQIPIERGSDVDDLWLNTLGALLGCFVYLLLRKKHPVFCDKFKQKHTEII